MDDTDDPFAHLAAPVAASDDRDPFSHLSSDQSSGGSNLGVDPRNGQPVQEINDAKKQWAQNIADNQRSSVGDVATQIPSGVNRGVDAFLNMPEHLANFGARQLGYQEPFSNNDVHVAGAFNRPNPLKYIANSAAETAGYTDPYANVSDQDVKEPQTTAGRYTNAIAEQVGANAIPGIGMVGAGAKAIPVAANMLSSSVGSGVGEQGAKDLGLGPSWQLAASLAGGMVAPNVANSVFSRGPADPKLVEKTAAAQAAQEEGIDIPKAAVANSIIKPYAGRLASLPIVGAPLQNAAKASLNQTQQRLSDIADTYGVGNRLTAGSGMKDALVDYIENGSKAPINALYDKVSPLIDRERVYSLPATQRLSQELLNVPSAAMRDVNQKALAPVMEDINSGGLTYDALKQTRTVVGDMLDNKLSPNYKITEKPLRGLYGTLSDDLRNAVQDGGQPGALQAFDQANAATAALKKRAANLQKILGIRGDASGENVFDTMIQMAQNKGKSADVGKLALARKSVDPDTWGDFSSAFIRRMGIDDKTGDFSPDRFLTTYNNLSPQGKAIFFRGQGQTNDLKNSLDNLSKVSQQFSELYKMGNPSGTGGAMFLTGLSGVGSVGGLFNPLVWAGTGSSLGSMWAASRYLASPANVDKMTRTVAARAAAVRNPNPSTVERATQATASLANSMEDFSKQNPPPPKVNAVPDYANDHNSALTKAQDVMRRGANPTKVRQTLQSLGVPEWKSQQIFNQ